MVRLGINPLPWLLDTSFHLDEPSLRAGFAAVAAAGFTSVHADIPEEMTVDDYRALLGEFDLTAAPGYFSGSFEMEDSVEPARRRAERHAQLGLTTMFIAGNLSPARVAAPAAGTNFNAGVLDLFVANLAEACRAIRAEGLAPMLHPHVGTLVEVESEIRWVLDRTDPELLGFGPDTGHLRWAGTGIMSLIGDYRERILGAHIKDVDPIGVASAKLDSADYWQATRDHHVWTEPGRGDVDLVAIVEALKACPDLEWLVIEVDVPHIGTAEESTHASADWVREQPSLRASMRERGSHRQDD